MQKEKPLKLFGCLFLAAILVIQEKQPLEAKSANREYTIKAGLIIKILDFIVWPTGIIKGNNPHQFKFCILGENRFGNLLGHGTNEIFIKVNVEDQELRSCNIVFITGENLAQVNRAKFLLNNHPVLVIGESQGYGKLGADINLIKKKNKIKFEINRVSLNKKGIKVSSYLLNLAIIVGEQS